MRDGSGQAFRGQVAQRLRRRPSGRRDDAGRPGECSGRRVRHRRVVLLQVGAAQPQCRSGVRAPVAAGGERGQFGRTAASRRAHEGEHGGVRGRGEGVELPCGTGPFDRRRVRRARRAVLAHRRRRQFQDAREVQVGAVGGDRGRVLGEKGGQRAGGRWAEWDREALVAPAAAQCGAEDGDDRARLGVQDRAARRSSPEAQRVPARRADRQFQGVGEMVDTVRGGVGHRGGAQDPRLAPAACRDADVATGLRAPPDRHRQRRRAETLGADQREAEGGQGGDRVGRHLAAALPGRGQHQAGQTVHRLMAGEHRAVVVGHEAEAAQAPGEIVDADQGAVGVPGEPGHPRAVLRCPVAVPGPRAPSRHGRTSPPYRRTCSTVGAG